MSNKLSGERSPYLQMHKNNPVNWYPWCRQAFEIAQRENKPVFISIGYSACHWCHVVADESFSNPDFAAVAAAYGIPSITLREEADVESALDQFLGREGPCLLIAETGSGYMTTD